MNSNKNDAVNRENMLPFTNDFIFGMVMRDPKICMAFLKTVLPGEDFSEIRMKLPANPLLREEPLDENIDLEKLKIEIQKSLKFEGGMHGVRFDAYAETPEKCAEIEMQTGVDAFVGKRFRFYQCNMDLDHFEQGQPYSKLKRSFVIMVCTYDPFGLDEPVYFFQSWDEKNNLPLGDEAYKIILNTACTAAKVPEGLRALYEYINDPAKCEGSELVKAIDDRVRKFNGPDWRWRQVTLEYMMLEEYNRGLEEGIEKANIVAAAKLMDKINISAEEAFEILEIPQELYEKYKELLREHR